MNAKITSAEQLLKELSEMKGNVSISDGVMAFESGETVDLQKLLAGPVAKDAWSSEAIQSRWEDDATQFPRLIAEINATQEIDFSALAESMDLDESHIEQLFDRADAAWEASKDRLRTAPRI